MKRALFTFITDGVTYPVDTVYKDEDVAQCDPSNFENAGDATPATEEVVADVEEVKAPEVTGDENKGDTNAWITEQDLIDHPEYTQAGLTVGDAKPETKDADLDSDAGTQ